MESIHKKLNRVRKPRVHITFDVETEGAVEKKELPFVVGVLGDYSGNNVPDSEKKNIKDKSFVQIDRDNFNTVLEKINPRLAFKVKNTLQGDDTEIPIELSFKNIDDFSPGKVVEQVAPLKKMLEMRNKLRDLLSKCDRSEGLENVLEKILSNDENISQLAKSLADEIKNSKNEE